MIGQDLSSLTSMPLQALSDRLSPKIPHVRSKSGLNGMLDRKSRLFRPHSWAGILQKLVPRRAAPLPPPPALKRKDDETFGPLYTEINKPGLPAKSGSPTYCLSQSVGSAESCFDNYAGELANSIPWEACFLTYRYPSLQLFLPLASPSLCSPSLSLPSPSLSLPSLTALR